MTAKYARLACLWALFVGPVGCTHGPKPEPEPMASTPVVLIIGDSISMDGGYLPGVTRRLGDRFRVIHNPDNGGDSADILAHVDEWLAAAEPDIVHFNCGLHDSKFDRLRKTRQQEPQAYERNLREIIRRLRARPETRLIFALTTPVNEEWHRAARPFDRRAADVILYNTIARRVMSENAIPINDLHQVITDAVPDTCLLPDGVHFNAKGNALLAEAVAAMIDRVAVGADGPRRDSRPSGSGSERISGAAAADGDGGR